MPAKASRQTVVPERQRPCNRRAALRRTGPAVRSTPRVRERNSITAAWLGPSAVSHRLRSNSYRRSAFDRFPRVAVQPWRWPRLRRPFPSDRRRARANTWRASACSRSWRAARAKAHARSLIDGGEVRAPPGDVRRGWARAGTPQSRSWASASGSAFAQLPGCTPTNQLSTRRISMSFSICAMRRSPAPLFRMARTSLLEIHRVIEVVHGGAKVGQFFEQIGDLGMARPSGRSSSASARSSCARASRYSSTSLAGASHDRPVASGLVVRHGRGPGAAG